MPTITEFGVNVTRKVDTGYAPYIKKLDALNGRQPPFGLREQSSFEMSVWTKGMLEEGDDLNTVVQEMALILEESIQERLDANGIVREYAPEEFAKVADTTKITIPNAEY